MAAMHQLQLYIKRTAEPTEQKSPWEDIAFIHAVESDELSDALKIAYPHYRTLRERKHAAIIDFFRHELAKMQTNDTSPNFGIPSINPQPPGIGMECSDIHSIHSRAPPTPPANPAMPGASQERERRLTVQSLPADPTLATSSTQLIFNAFDGRPMQQKTKRKMTFDERQDYKETRRRGACADCKRSKGKCTHVDDVDPPFDSTDQSTRHFKRMIVPQTHTSDLKPVEALNPDQATDTSIHDSNHFQQHISTAQEQPVLQVSRCSSGATDQSRVASNEPQLPLETRHTQDVSRIVTDTSSHESEGPPSSDAPTPASTTSQMSVSSTITSVWPGLSPDGLCGPK